MTDKHSKTPQDISSKATPATADIAASELFTNVAIGDIVTYSNGRTIKVTTKHWQVQPDGSLEVVISGVES